MIPARLFAANFLFGRASRRRETRERLKIPGVLFKRRRWGTTVPGMQHTGVGWGFAALHVGNRSLWPVGQLRSLSLRHFPPCLCRDYVLRVLELTSCSDCSRGLYLFQDSPGYTVCRSRSGKLRHLGRGRPEFGGRPLRVCTPPPAGKHESGCSCVTWGPPEPSQLLRLKWPEPAAFLVWFAGEGNGAAFFFFFSPPLRETESNFDALNSLKFRGGDWRP